ncbi:MAG: tetratricopeptide repeat protein [Bacteroidales bacterium]|nr:tetratricopeptide repeat protein [Bacteroidales bacterium]
MKNIKYILVLVLSLVAATQAEAQVDKRDVRRGNREFRKENWRAAEIDYRKALVKDSLSVAANYNLANTLFREGDVEQAQKVMETVKEVAPASASAADYYYNLGDVAIARQDWHGAVDAFKESLLRNPGDLYAKENYIFAKKKLEDQQNQQQNQDQNQDQNDQNQDQNDNQNDNQDDQNQDQNDDQNDQNKDQNDQNQDQDNKNDQNKDQNQDKQQNNQGQQPKISPQAAQQMLQAIQAKEKETQDKVNKQKAEALKSRQKEKNW